MKIICTLEEKNKLIRFFSLKCGSCLIYDKCQDSKYDDCGDVLETEIDWEIKIKYMWNKEKAK